MVRVVDRKSGIEFDEDISIWLEVGLKLLKYVPKGINRGINNHITFKNCALEFNDKDKGQTLIHDYIRKYKKSIRLHEIEKPLSEYKTLNDFFQRRLKRGVRPISAIHDGKVMIVPADSRISVFSTISTAQSIWIKGSDFSIESLMGVSKKEDLPLDLRDNPSIVICRLAPQDYHRYHFPIDCDFHGMEYVGSEYYSVNPITIKDNRTNVFSVNRRATTVLDTKYFGQIGMVAVGATCTGSIKTLAKCGKKKKGSQCGTFGFGGSTVVLVINRKNINFAQELLWASENGKETYVHVGQWLGMYPKHPCSFTT